MAFRRRPCGLLLAGVLVLSALPAQPAPAGAARPRPDLEVASVAAPASAAAGAPVTVRAKVRNTGRAAAPRSTLRVLLSTDRRPGRTDPTLASVAVKRLPAGRSTRLRIPVVVPARTKPGSHHLLVCADATSKVKESAERDNCTARAFSVLAGRPTQPPPDPDPDPPSFPMTPDPVSASGVVLEEGRAARRTFDPEDPATLTPLRATAADGTTYTLEVPAEALLTAEEITMTPLATATVPILSPGFVAGVDLEPDGLMLQAPVRLTIQSPAPGPLAQQTAYVFHEGGEDFHAHPMAAPAPADGPGTVRMELSHFSTAGLAGGTAAQRADLGAHPPVRSQAQAASAISGLVSGARASGGDASAAMGQARAVLHSYYDQVVDGRMAAAQTDASLAAGATAEAVSLMRQLALLGEESGPVHDRIMKRLEAIWANAVEHYRGRCAQHDLTAIGMLVGIARQMFLLGYEELGNRAWEHALRCSRYEVTYASAMGYERDHWPNDETYSQARADLRLTSTTTVPGVAPGVGTLDYTSAELWAKTGGDDGSEPCPCWIEDTLIGTAPGSITVDVLERANPVDPGPGGPPPAPPVPYVRLLPGVGADGAADPPRERLRRTSNPVYDGPREMDSTFWHSQVLAFSDFYPVRFEVDLAQSAGSAVLLDRTWDFSFGTVGAVTGRLTEQRAIKVTHTPGS